ncbi:MAG: hypothetical protein ABI959_05425 [Candidatus Dormiibacterota bacterium]
MAVGLGSMDMPVPAVAEWEWLNWKFPRAVHAGDTIYARWTLTQKRAPVGGSPTAIVVWRVDVHTAAGALCAEGEVGASVLRGPQARLAEPSPTEPAAAPASAAASGAVTARRGRRRRRTPASDAIEPKSAAAVDPVQAPPVAAATAAPERAASGRRRRRRRPTSSAAARNGETPGTVAPIEAPASTAVAPALTTPATANPLTRAIRRLRRP